MDVVVKTFLSPKHAINFDLLNTVIEALIRAVDPRVKMVIMAKGFPSESDEHMIRISMAVDEATKHQLETALNLLFNTVFSISFGDTSEILNRKDEIEGVTEGFLVNFAHMRPHHETTDPYDHQVEYYRDQKIPRNWDDISSYYD